MTDALAWDLEWGERAAWLLELADEDGTAPKALLNRPDLPDHLVFARDAFWSLSPDRPLGALGGCGHIPWSSIERYAARHGITDPDAFERFEALIGAQDRVYLKDVAAKAKIATNSAP
ncbi:phage tail assembly chaperone [Methylobacterium sp. C25]|uniref:phage tail assembly chaperone n=1 Tax=Methylobacterium sp. C25 TaxID=2721622 RepID=UPI003FA3AE26